MSSYSDNSIIDNGYGHPSVGVVSQVWARYKESVLSMRSSMFPMMEDFEEEEEEDEGDDSQSIDSVVEDEEEEEEEQYQRHRLPRSVHDNATATIAHGHFEVVDSTGWDEDGIPVVEVQPSCDSYYSTSDMPNDGYAAENDSCEVSYHAHIGRVSSCSFPYDEEQGIVQDEVFQVVGIDDDDTYIVEDPSLLVDVSSSDSATVLVAPPSDKKLKVVGDVASVGKKQTLSKASAKALTGSRKGRQSGDSKSSHHKHEEVTKPLRWFGHGKRWTFIAISLAWIGFALSVLARQSKSFLVLEEPVYMGRGKLPISKLALINQEICYNETLSAEAGCHTIVLRSDLVQDPMYELARVFGSASAIFGAFFCIFLTSAIFWETIDLRPIGFGMLLIYFFQSFTMLIFDANVCKKNMCAVGPGCLMCIAASACWVAACIAIAKMEAYKIIATRQRERRARRRARRAMKAAEKKRKEYERMQSSFTHHTVSTSSIVSSDELECAGVAHNTHAELSIYSEKQAGLYSEA